MNEKAKLTPIPAHPAHPVRNLEAARKRIQSEQAEQAAEGLVRIEPIVGLDIVPNKITSTPPDPITVRPEECWVNRDYQRNLSRKSLKLIHDMVTNWDWAKFKPPVLTKDEEGRFLIIDGQHTAIGAATHPDIQKIPAMFIPLTHISEQAASFIGHNTARINVSALDLYHARIESGEDLVVTADKVMKDHGINVVRSVQGRGHVWQTNQTMASAIVLKILEKHGLPKFLAIVEFVAKCGFSPIKADHWRFAEALLTPTEKAYIPSMMLEVVKAINDQDALNEASKIAASMQVSNAKALLIYYKNRYKETYKIR